jgi:hypothetical protein
MGTGRGNTVAEVVVEEKRKGRGERGRGRERSRRRWEEGGGGERSTEIFGVVGNGKWAEWNGKVEEGR